MPNCERCGVDFEYKRRKTQRFCSSDCSNKRRGDNFVARFHASVDRSAGPAGCWVWTGSMDKDGYGKVHHYSVGDTRAHRVAFELNSGLPLRSLPSSVLVRHTCDNPSCCNPAHLLAGSHQDNTEDKVTRNRHTKGAGVNTAKVTESDVLEARRLYRFGDVPVKELCFQFGLSKSSMYYLLKGISWSHLPL